MSKNTHKNILERKEISLPFDWKLGKLKRPVCKCHVVFLGTAVFSRSTLDTIATAAYKETVGPLFPVMCSGILPVQLKMWLIISLVDIVSLVTPK